MKNKKMLQASSCLVVATIFSLTTHIYVSKWAKPSLDAMMQGIFPEPPPYSSLIISAAYGTAFITVGLKVFLYYHAQHLFFNKSNLIKTFLIACISLELSGDLIRKPIMDVLVNFTMGLKHPFLFVMLNQMDKWLSALLLAACLVYLCPKKLNTPKERGNLFKILSG